MIVVAAGGLDVSKGTALAQDLAHKYRKPLLLVSLVEPDGHKRAVLWMRVQQARRGAGVKLTIGGPRESEVTGIYERAVVFMRALLD
jgi:hypothetical protein